MEITKDIFAVIGIIAVIVIIFMVLLTYNILPLTKNKEEK